MAAWIDALRARIDVRVSDVADELRDLADFLRAFAEPLDPLRGLLHLVRMRSMAPSCCAPFSVRAGREARASLATDADCCVLAATI